MTSAPLVTDALVACPICGNSVFYESFQVPDILLDPLQVQQCAQCGICFLSPRLTADAVLQVENESSVYAYTPAQTETIIREQSLPLVHWIPQFARTTGRRWLDIGCNRGLLLEAARRQGWEPTGVEIAQEAAAHARAGFGLTVYAGLDELPPDARFDVITAWHVLEHTFDPVALLRTAASRLAPGGALAIQVPSYDFVEEYRQRNQMSSLVCAVHNFCFTLDSLRMVLARSGLHVLHLENNAEFLLLTAVATNQPPRPSLAARMRGWLRG